MKSITKLRITGAAAAGLALSAIGLGGVASTAAAERGIQADATIRIVGGPDQRLQFKGPESVDEDSILRIVNKTDPQQVGPHTFSLVRHHTYPSPDQFDRCEQLELICGEIADWHGFGGPNEQSRVDVKQIGWDKMGDFQDTGDSWFTEQEGEKELRTVSHEHKGKLHFICAVHPFMRGSIVVNQFKPTK